MDSYLSFIFDQETLSSKKQDIINASGSVSFEKIRSLSLSPQYWAKTVGQLVESLTKIYSQWEPPLIAKLSSRRASLIGKQRPVSDDEEEDEEPIQAPLDFYTQAQPLLTQPSETAMSEVGPVLLPSTQSGAEFFATSPAVLPHTSSGVPATSTIPENEELRSEVLEPTQVVDTQVLPTHAIPSPKAPNAETFREMIRTVPTEVLKNLISPSKVETNESPKQATTPTTTKNLKHLAPAPVSSGLKAASTPQKREALGEIRVIAPHVLKKILKVCDEDAEALFLEHDVAIENSYKEYAVYQQRVNDDKELPPLKQLLPRESSPLVAPTGKRIRFESELDFQETPMKPPIELRKKKKSMLLPNETANRLVWTPEKENKAEKTPQPNSQPNSSETKVPVAPATVPVSNIAAGIPDVEAAAPSLRSALRTGRRKWDREEVEMLKDGLRRYGRKWAIIHASYNFKDRTAIDLKDKARNLAKAGLIILPSKSKK